jgi:hypothetical protein
MFFFPHLRSFGLNNFPDWFLFSIFTNHELSEPYNMGEQAGVAVTLYAFIRVVLGSNLGRDSGYPE